MSANARTAIVCCMRNEGMFVLEWLAHHLACGFDSVFVYSNDCRDGSDLLLARLDALGWLAHTDHHPPQGASPQNHATALAMADPRVQAHDWLLHIDADEFLYLAPPRATVGALLAQIGDRADIIIFLWKLFGDNGIARWQGGSVLQQFTRSQGVPMRRTVHHKSMFRPQKFEVCANHMPRLPRPAEVRLVNSRGDRLDPASVFAERKSRYKVPFRHQVFDNACLHHYAVKSPDLFLIKNDRGDGHGSSHSLYHLHSDLHRRYNRNEVEDRTILRFWPRIAALMARMRADPEVARLERQCLDWYLARRAAVLTPEQVAAWTAPGQQ